MSFQVISNLIDHGMSLQEAIEAPRWSSIPGTLAEEKNDPYKLLLENRFADGVVEGLTQKGHTVTLSGPWSFGSVKAVIQDPETGVLYGSADPRRDGYAVGY